MSRVTGGLTTLLVGLISAGCLAAAGGDTPEPQYGAWGFDLAGADFITKPGDDFFRYANGSWLDKTQISADRARYTLRLVMDNLIEQRLHELMETLAAKDTGEPSSLEDKVGAFYRSFMDQGRIQQLMGAKAIAGELDEVKRAKTRADLFALSFCPRHGVRPMHQAEASRTWRR